MRTRFVRTLLAVSTAALVAACGGEDTPAEPDDTDSSGPGPAATIAVVSGDNQTAGRTEALADPLVVRVTDQEGAGVPDVSVSFAITDGMGRLSVSARATDENGEASVTLFLGHLPGETTVRATADGVSGQAATFTATAEDRGPITVTVEMENTAFVAPNGTDDLTILLGDTVRFINRDAVQHTATSGTGGSTGGGVPSAGTAFDTAFLNQGQSESVVPDAQGTWTYFCRVHPGIMVDATIEVM